MARLLHNKFTNKIGHSAYYDRDIETKFESIFMITLFLNSLPIFQIFSIFRTEWILALRAITQKPLQFFLERAQDFAEHQPTYGTDDKTPPDFVYDSSDFKSIFNLVRFSVSTGNV